MLFMAAPAESLSFRKPNRLENLIVTARYFLFRYEVAAAAAAFLEKENLYIRIVIRAVFSQAIIFFRVKAMRPETFRNVAEVTVVAFTATFLYLCNVSARLPF